VAKKSSIFWAIMRCKRTTRHYVSEGKIFQSFVLVTIVFTLVVKHIFDTKCLTLITRTVTIVTASVKEGEEGGARSHFRKPIASVCHVTLRCEHVLFLHECFFDFVFPFGRDG
jgi:hypothetical protein